jgi:Cadherin-like beta sandwich domain
MKIKSILVSLVVFLAVIFGVGTPSQAASPTITVGVTGDCQTWFKFHGSYQISPSARACNVSLKTSSVKPIRQARLEFRTTGNWMADSTATFNSKGQATLSLDSSCTVTSNQCAGTYSYRVLILKSGSLPQLVAKTFTMTVSAGTPPAPDNSLADVSLSAFTVNGSPVTEGATVSLPSGTTSVPVVATASNQAARVSIQGNANLIEGTNSLAVIVTAANGTTSRTYRITLNVAAFDYEKAIRDFYYDLSQAPDTMEFVDAHTDATYFKKTDSRWAARKALLSKYHKYERITTVAGYTSLTPDWRWGSGTCHDAMTAARPGKTYVVRLNITEGSDIEDPSTYTADLHVTISPSGTIYIYNDICMGNFGNTVLLDKTLVEKSIKDTYSARGITVNPTCPDPMYGKVGDKRYCTFPYGGTFYQVEVTIQDLAGNIIWVTKT